MAYLKSFDFNTLKKIAWEGDIPHTDRQTDAAESVASPGTELSCL